MANRKLSELTTRTGGTLSDLFLVGDPVNGFAYKMTGTALQTLLGVTSGIVTGSSSTTGSALIVRNSALNNVLNAQNNGLVAIGTQTPTAFMDVAGSTASSAAIRIRNGATPTTPNLGDLWYDGVSLKFNAQTWGTGVIQTTAPRYFTTTSTTSLSIDISNYDIFLVTAQTTAIALANPTGTPSDGQKFIVRINTTTGGGAITFGTNFRASTDLVFPSTTTTGKTTYMGFMYNATATKWDMIAKLENF